MVAVLQFLKPWIIRASWLLILPTLLFFYRGTLLIPPEGIHIIRDEGVSFYVYEDSLGYATGGVGHLLTEEDKKTYQKGDYIPSEQIREWLLKDFKTAREVAEELAPNGSDTAQDILTNMAFNLGETRLRKFKKMLSYLDKGDCLNASKEMLDSKWAKQVGERAVRLSERMKYCH